MSRVISNENLKTVLSFIPDNAIVTCRDLGYGYQLVFKLKDGDDTRIFISKEKE